MGRREIYGPSRVNDVLVWRSRVAAERAGRAPGSRCSARLARQPPAASLRQLQRQLDTFRAYYNHIRPHRALGRRTPAQAYAARAKAAPTGTPLDTGHWRTRHDRIDASGVFTLRHNSRLHHIGLGRRHAGVRVLVLARDLDIRVLTTDGELLRKLTLDPSRDYQPQARS